MNKAVFWIFITLVFIVYYIFVYTDNPECQNEVVQAVNIPRKIDTDCFYMKYDSFFVCIDPVSETLYLSSNPEEAERFSIVNIDGINKRKNAIKSSTLDKWITIDYENDQSSKKYIQFKETDQILKDNSIKIKIIKKRNRHLIKFFSGDLLCLDKATGNFYSSRNDKWNIFYFKMIN
jgi:hypothetical protein